MAMELPPRIEAAITALEMDDRAAHGVAYEALVSSSESASDWAPLAWVRLLPMLRSPDGRARSIAGQALCRIAQDVPVLDVSASMSMILAVTYDEKFVTARHVLLASWRLAMRGDDVGDAYLAWTRDRWAKTRHEKNGSLIRHDLITTLAALHKTRPSPALVRTALDLLADESDARNLKKLAPLQRLFERKAKQVLSTPD